MVETALQVSNTEIVPLLGTDVIFVSAEITEVAVGYSTAVFTYDTATPDYVDNILKNTMSGATPIIRWRLGFGTPGGAATWTTQQDYVVQHYGAVRDGIGNQNGYRVKIYAADALWQIDRLKHTVGRNGKISAIVSSIADAYKLGKVIEPTVVTGGYIQSFQSDYVFIKDRMRPRATNSQNRGNYQFYVRDGNLHFHTIDYQSDLKTFAYYNSPGISLVQTDHTQEGIVWGTAGVRNVVADPYTGAFTEILSSTQNTLRLANTSPGVENLNGAQLNLMSSLGTNRLPDAQAINTSVFEGGNTKAYALQLTIPKTVFFRANDLVQMTIQPKVSTTPAWNGLYQASTVKYFVDRTSVFAKVELVRGEYSSGGSTFAPLAQIGEPVIQPQQAAAGRDPNFVSVDSSPVTKGTGNQLSKGRIVDTQDPEAAILPAT